MNPVLVVFVVYFFKILVKMNKRNLSIREKYEAKHCHTVDKTEATSA